MAEAATQRSRAEVEAVAQVVRPEEAHSSGTKSSPWLGHGGRALLRAASARWSCDRTAKLKL